MDLDDMNAELGGKYARGEFDTTVLDGELVARVIQLRSYGRLLVEYRYPDGRPSKWGVLVPQWRDEVIMDHEQLTLVRDTLDVALDLVGQANPSGRRDVSVHAPRWFARPDSEPVPLRMAPQLECWNKADDPAQRRLQHYLDDTVDLLSPNRIHDQPWALRLDVGLPTGRDLLDMADLDNYLFPLAKRLADRSQGASGLVSAWCTKQHGEQSFVRIAPARQVPPPDRGIVTAAISPPAANYKRQVRAAVAHANELPAGPVRLELAFIIGPGRNWLNLWKPTIDALDPLLGRTYPDRDWHPLDGRITELGLHLTVDATAGHDVVVGIFAATA